MNLHRLHLTASQKSMVAVELEKRFAMEANERQREAGGDRKTPDKNSVPAYLPEAI